MREAVFWGMLRSWHVRIDGGCAAGRGIQRIGGEPRLAVESGAEAPQSKDGKHKRRRFAYPKPLLRWG
jgi:hypothetical protein